MLLICALPNSYFGEACSLTTVLQGMEKYVDSTVYALGCEVYCNDTSGFAKYVHQEQGVVRGLCSLRSLGMRHGAVSSLVCDTSPW